MMHPARTDDHAGPPLSERDAEHRLHGICFKTGPPRALGVELEWLVCDGSDPALPVPHEKVARCLAALDRPGGLPGLTLVGHGFDPCRPPRRVLDLPRYAAMEEFFDRDGRWGRLMMGNTASVQVCVDAGLECTGSSGFRFRWRLLHALGPVLVAAFADSPLRADRPTGWNANRGLGQVPALRRGQGAGRRRIPDALVVAGRRRPVRLVPLGTLLRPSERARAGRPPIGPLDGRGIGASGQPVPALRSGI
jgi:hypothetical protein